MARMDWKSSFSQEKFQEDKALADQSGGAFRDWKAGKNIVRILPPLANTGWTKGRVLVPTWMYWRLPPNDGMGRDIRRTFGPDHDDPIDDCLKQLRALGVDTTKLEAKSRVSFYANVVDMEESELRVSVQKFPKGLAQWVFGQLADEDVAGPEMINPYAGTSLIVQYDPDAKDNNKMYIPSWQIRQMNKPLCEGGDGAVDELLAQCKDIAGVIEPPDAEGMEKLTEAAKELYEYAAPADPVPAQRATGQEQEVQQDQLDDDDLPF